MIVVRTTTWTRKFGGSALGNGPGLIDGKVTHVRIGGIDCFVRENFRADTFREMNSGSRVGFARRGAPRDCQVLELATYGDFDALAKIIRAADALKRPVIRNRHWLVPTAKRLFREREVPRQRSEQAVLA